MFDLRTNRQPHLSFSGVAEILKQPKSQREELLNQLKAKLTTKKESTTEVGESGLVVSKNAPIKKIMSLMELFSQNPGDYVDPEKHPTGYGYPN